MTYPDICACSTLLVLLMVGSFIQLGPQCFGLPGGDCCFQTAVEASVISRVKLQLPAQQAESLESAFTRGSLNKVLEELAGLRAPLVLCFTHCSVFPSQKGAKLKARLLQVSSPTSTEKEMVERE